MPVNEDLLNRAIEEALATEAESQFRMFGTVQPLLEKAVPDGYRPKRRLGGWLATFGQIGPNGGIVPTVDRDGQVFEAARRLGSIDWTGYLAKGLVNDRHFDGIVNKPERIVGMADTLEFADEHTPLGQSHRKVGFYTTVHLFDRNDPRSWAGLGRDPKPHELAKADEYWELAQLLDGTPRELGFSAHGKYAAAGNRITFAQIDQVAIAQLPKNPDATAQLLKSFGAGLEDLLKAVSSEYVPGRAIVQEDLEGAPPSSEAQAVERIMRLMMERFKLTRHQAQRALNAWMKTNRITPQEA